MDDPRSQRKDPVRIAVRGLLFLLIFFCPFKDSVFGGCLTATNLLFVALVLNRRELKSFFGSQPLWVALAGIFLSMTLSNARGIGGMEGWRAQIEFFLHFCLMFYAVSYFLQKGFVSVRFLVVSIVVTAGIHGLDGLYQFFVGHDFFKYQPLDHGRISGVVYNPNHFGLVVMVVFHLLFYLLTKRRYLHLHWGEQVGVSLLLVLTAFGLLYSGSRAAWLGTGLPLILYWLLNLKDRETSFCCLVSAVLLLIAGVFGYTDANLLHRFGTILQGESGLRFETWDTVLEHFLRQPFFGYGIMGYRHLVPVTDVDVRVLNFPHNILLEIILYLGLAGAAAFGYCFYCILGRLWQYRDRPHQFSIYATILAGLFIYGQFGGSLTTDKIFLTISVLVSAFLFAGSDPDTPDDACNSGDTPSKERHADQ